MLQLIRHASKQLEKTAIVSDGKNYTYENLLSASYQLACVLLDGQKDLNEARVAFMVNPSFEYVATQWGIWRAGGVAVPLALSYPLPSIKYVLEDTEAKIVVATADYAAFLAPLIQELDLRLIILDELSDDALYFALLPDTELTPDRRAMILYTSGTTNLPKGVVTTHANLNAQISTLVKAWEWSAADYTVCILPMHHVHGIINVTCCALWSGATVQFLPSFSAEEVFQLFREGNINVFMAVPTIYFKLISYWENLPENEQRTLTETMSKFRLMVSGSAALPVSVMEKWESISTHRLLERYGMTEIGMGISNPYNGERKAGYIGQPLPGVKARLVDENNKVVKKGTPGEIQIKGKNVFLEYWQREKATKEAFTEDGWFRTGDVAVVEDGYYRILGRDSIDIIKSGGYKISALEIEEILRTHPAIKDCSVVGLPNEEWGELVAAALILADTSFDTSTLTSWIRERMPAYKTPRQYKIVEDFPRNAMGKVVKNDLKKVF